MHLADVHLGLLPDKNQKWSEDRKNELYVTFREVVLSANKNKVDIVLIAGDLFHGQPLLKDLKEVNYLFEKISPIKIVMIAGNHDYIRMDSYYSSFKWSDNVFFLTDKKKSAVSFADLNTTVYGCSYHSREMKNPIYEDWKPRDSSQINILLGHGGDATHAPFAYQNLVKNGFDYCAFGHIHKPFVSGDRRFAFAGSLEPTDRNDIGRRGYILGKVDEQTRKVSLKFMPAAKRQYIRLEVVVTADSTNQSVAEEITGQIEKLGVQHIFQVILQGIRDENMNFELDKYLTNFNISTIEDKTQVDYDYEELLQIHASSIVGQVIQELKDVDNEAMFYAVNALLRTKR